MITFHAEDLCRPKNIPCILEIKHSQPLSRWEALTGLTFTPNHQDMWTWIPWLYCTCARAFCCSVRHTAFIRLTCRQSDLQSGRTAEEGLGHQTSSSDCQWRETQNKQWKDSGRESGRKKQEKKSGVCVCVLRGVGRLEGCWEARGLLKWFRLTTKCHDVRWGWTQMQGSTEA